MYVSPGGRRAVQALPRQVCARGKLGVTRHSGKSNSSSTTHEGSASEPAIRVTRGRRIASSQSLGKAKAGSLIVTDNLLDEKRYHLARSGARGINCRAVLDGCALLHLVPDTPVPYPQ